MASFVVLCALFCLIQTSLCQIMAPGNVGYANRMGPANNVNFGNNLPCNNVNNLAANSINGIPMASTSQGYGDVSVVGELPVGGNTVVTGNVPVIGYVTFEGTVPAGGIVSVASY